MGKLLCSPGLQGQQADLMLPTNEKKTDCYEIDDIILLAMSPTMSSLI